MLARMQMPAMPSAMNSPTTALNSIYRQAPTLVSYKQVTACRTDKLILNEYVTFKTECSNVVSYISNIEFLDLGAIFKQELEAGKATFRKIRDDIAEGISVTAQKVQIRQAEENT